MEKRYQNGHSFKQKAASLDKKGTSGADDYGQLDNIIGGFGKYQLMIFMFKILIGATSVFNNLGVTFFAPADFISFWCADEEFLSLANTNNNNYNNYNNFNYNNAVGLSSAASSAANYATTIINATTALNYDLHTNPVMSRLVASSGVESGSSAVGRSFASSGGGAAAAAGSGKNQSVLLLESGHHVQMPPPTRTFVTQNIRQLLGDFVFSQERSQRKQEASFNSDTPRNLRKQCDFLSPVDNKRHKCTSYKYDTGIWISTIIDEWNLVCDRAWFISITQSLYMGGFIVSYLVFGYISDRFGRWNSLVLGALIEILSGFGCAFAGSVGAFMVFRFLLGLGNAGRSSSSYLIMIEWTGQSWRMHISTLGSLGWVIGYCFMPWIVLFFLHFRHMQLFVCFYEFVFLIWLLRLPESPRWLLTHHRFSEAYQVLLNAAKFNGLIMKEDEKMIIDGREITHTKPVTAAQHSQQQQEQQQQSQHQVEFDIATNSSGDFGEINERKSLRPYTMEEFELKFARLTETIQQKEFSKNEDRLSILDLFKWPNLRKYMLTLAFAWCVNSFIYYGIALRVGDFGAKNLFVSFTFAGATELPSIGFTIICMKFLPRRTTNIFLFSVIFLICALQVPLKYYDIAWLQQATMMLAKLFNSCSFTCILYQTMELFPTSIRQTAYSSCSLAGRIGSILAPFVKELSQVTNSMVVPIIYAVLSIFEILTISYLPETQGSDLPDTLLEAESFRGTDKRPEVGIINGTSCEINDDFNLRRRKLSA